MSDSLVKWTDAISGAMTNVHGQLRVESSELPFNLKIAMNPLKSSSVGRTIGIQYSGK